MRKMFKIQDKTIHITRGDEGTISIKVPIDRTTTPITYYEFQPDDVITFTVKRKNGFNSEEYTLRKEVTLTEATTNPLVPLTREDTLIGDLINKPVTYWYELTLNDDQSFVCYDEDGAKEFILYPDGFDGSDI